MPTIEIFERTIEVDEDFITRLEKEGLLKIENKVNPLLLDYNEYKLEVSKLVEMFISNSIELEKLMKYEGSLSEYQILKTIDKFSVVSPKLLEKQLPISRSWVNRKLSDLLEKKYIKKIEKGLYQLDEKGKEVIK